MRWVLLEVNSDTKLGISAIKDFRSELSMDIDEANFESEVTYELHTIFEFDEDVL